jgi:hypothetical protein
MPGYITVPDQVAVCRVDDLHIRPLLDRQQNADSQGLAEAADISGAQWSLFGLLRPAGQQLADGMTAPEGTGLQRRSAPSEAAGQWCARKAIEVVCSHRDKLEAALQSPGALLAPWCRRLRNLLRGLWD